MTGLIAKMMLEENANKVVITADICDQAKCYRQGAMVNYSIAFSVSVKKQPENEEIVDAADYITENYAVEFDEAEMILTEIPEDCFLSKYGDTQDVIRKKWVIIL